MAGCTRLAEYVGIVLPDPSFAKRLHTARTPEVGQARQINDSESIGNVSEISSLCKVLCAMMKCHLQRHGDFQNACDLSGVKVLQDQ